MDFDLKEVKGNTEGVKRIRQFLGSCKFYRRHLRNFTYSSAPLTDLMKQETKLEWTSKEEERCKKASCKESKLKGCLILGVPRPERRNRTGDRCLEHWWWRYPPTMAAHARGTMSRSISQVVNLRSQPGWDAKARLRRGMEVSSTWTLELEVERCQEEPPHIRAGDHERGVVTDQSVAYCGLQPGDLVV